MALRMIHNLSALRRIALALPLVAAGMSPLSAAAAPKPAASAAKAKVVAAPPAVAAASAVITVAPGEILKVPMLPIVAANFRTCTAMTASGLGTKALKTSEGPKPTKADYVLVSYIGYLAADGTVFDQNAGTAFPLGGVIAGFSEGIQMMARGSVSRLCIPAAIGYGAKSTGPIPANADLVFQVELLDFKTQAEVAKINADGARQAQEQAREQASGAANAEAPAPMPSGQAKPPR